MHINPSSGSAFVTSAGNKRRTIDSIADDQRRLITTQQAIACGLSRRAISGRLASGTFHRAYRGVHLVGTSVLTEPRRRLGVTLAYGGNSALTGRAGLDGWDFTRFTRKTRDTPLEVVTSTKRRLSIPEAELGLSTRFNASHRVWHEGEWLASVAWTITDLGRYLTGHQLANVLHEAAFHYRDSLDDVATLIEVRGAFPGVRVVRHAIELARSGSRGTRSLSEDRFLEIARLVTRDVPVVNTPHPFAGVWIEPDFAWRSKRLIVELDGGQHGSTAHSVLDDRGRDAAYLTEGCAVWRPPSRAVWNDPGWCAEQLARRLGL